MNRLPLGRGKWLCAFSGFILTLAGGINAAPPAWWSNGNPPVINPAAQEDNHGVANIGQAKWMAKNALNAIRGVHPATADAIEAELVGFGKPLASWDPPVTQDQKDAQRAPLLVGQLKAIAAPFYSKLHALDSAWLDSQLTQNQTKDASDLANFYPWSSSTTDDNNKAPVSIGQLKAVFSLRLESLVIEPPLVNADQDEDGLPDNWELLHGLDPTDDGSINPDNGPDGDPDGDGVPNSSELEEDTAPDNASDFPPQLLMISKSVQGYSNSVPYPPDMDPYITILYGGAEWLSDSTINPPWTKAYPATPAYLLPLLEGMAFPAIPPVPPQDQPFRVPQMTLKSSWTGGFSWTNSFVRMPVVGGGFDTMLRSSRLWIKAPASPTVQTFPFVKLKEVHTQVYATDARTSAFSCEMVKLEIPAHQALSNPIDLKPIPTIVEGSDLYTHEQLLTVEVAPEVLAVNSDFDEGRIDPTTGYAIPDCDDMPGVDLKTGAGNTKLELDAERTHLDGTFTQGQDVKDDLHKGWFGVNPNNFIPSLWDGANVTIRKIDKIDSDTGYKESGQVRFYAKFNGGYYGISPYDFQTLQPVNLVSGGVNLRPNEGVYGSTSTIPGDAEFYMEGVRPGKITLEWRLQKGSIDVKYEQTFKVETRKTVAEWQEEVRYQIRLQTKVKSGTEVDIALYHPGNGFRNTNGNQLPGFDNVLRVQAIYYYYQQLFKQMPEKFMWAGMAKTASASIYAGMSDLTTWAQVQDGVPFQEYGTATHIMVRGLLLGGQKKIFEDMGWAHRAYIGSGRWALDWVDQNTIQKPTDFAAWRDLYEGIESSNQNKINIANRDLLLREQRDVVQSSYTSFATNGWFLQPRTGYNWLNNIASWLLNFQVVAEDPGLGANVGEWLSANALRNPMPGGPAFRATVPNGRIDSFNDRWAWTNNSINGMLQIWTGYSAGQRLSENNKTMYSGAAAYSFDTGGLPIE